MTEQIILSEEFRRMQKLAGIITEVDYRITHLINEFLLVETESTSPSIDVLVKQVANTGVNIKDEDVQLDLLDKFIDSDFHPEKINPKQIKEYKRSLNEDEGTFASSIEALKNSEVIKKLSKALNVSIEVIKKAITFLQKISEWPFEQIKKVFYKLARLFGASVEMAEKWGIGGLTVISLICVVFGILHYPAILATIGGSFGIISFMKLIYSLVKSIAGLKDLYKTFKDFQQESNESIYTTTDFLTNIESTYKKENNETKIPTDWIFSLKKWYNNIKNKEQVSKLMKKISQNVKMGEKGGYDINNLITLTKDNEKITKIFQDIKNGLKLG